jgi:hypothetical protein
MKYKVLIIFISLLIAVLAWFLCQDHRRAQVRTVVCQFCQALIDKDYEKAASFFAQKRYGGKWDSEDVQEVVESFFDHGQYCMNRPGFRELKHYSIQDISDYYQDNWERRNQYEVYVIFYSTEDKKEDSSNMMTLHMDKIDSTFKIRYITIDWSSKEQLYCTGITRKSQAVLTDLLVITGVSREGMFNGDRCLSRGERHA